MLIISCCLLLTTAINAEVLTDKSIKRAINHKDRFAGDIKQDEKRKPEKILNFFKIKPQTVVLDVLAGGGYYTELVSRIVGEKGKVIIHNDEHFLKYYGETLTKRLASGNRLTNIERIDASLNDLELKENSIDTILLFLGYHDFYYDTGEFEKINVKQILNKFKHFLKPNGTIGIVDHEALSGSPNSVGGTLHRIDPQNVKNEMINAGFELDGELSILKNTTDDKRNAIWNIPERKTSRFVMRFINKK